MRRYRIIGFFLALLVLGEVTLYIVRRPRAATERPLVTPSGVPVSTVPRVVYPSPPPTVYESGTTTILVFDAPFETSDALRICFRNALGGAHVDATGHIRGTLDDVPLLRRERIGTNALDLRWRSYDFDRIRVEIHHHYRPSPVVWSWAWLEPARS